MHTHFRVAVLKKKRSLIGPYFRGTYKRVAIRMMGLINLKWIDKLLHSIEERVACSVLERQFIKNFSRNKVIGFADGDDCGLVFLKILKENA